MEFNNIKSKFPIFKQKSMESLWFILTALIPLRNQKL